MDIIDAIEEVLRLARENTKKNPPPNAEDLQWQIEAANMLEDFTLNNLSD